MHTIILFYKYIHIENPEELRKSQLGLSLRFNLKGRVIVAEEGINATLEGTAENIDEYLKQFLVDKRFAYTDIKKSVGTGNAFPKLKVKVRPEIVSLHLEDDIDPNQITGKHLKPEELKKWYEDGRELYVIDMRNDYEFNVGRFKNSRLIPVQNFRDLPAMLRKAMQTGIPKVSSGIWDLQDKTVLAVCTGGVRCEKASGLLIREGFKDVYQLDGGIVRYMEKFPAQEFQGSLYVFDNRITMDFDSKEKHVVVGKCDKCAASSERYVNCKNPKCNKHFICCEDCSEEEKPFCKECKK